MPDFAGNTPKSAYNVGTLSSPSVYTYTDWVGGIDPDDYYKFTLSGTNFFRASLSGMTGDANVSLYDANDVLIINSRNAGATPEALDIPIVAGDYYIRVTPASLVGDDSFYSLSLDAVSLFDGAGATFSTARNLSSSSVPIIYDDWVGLVDPIDLYKVTLSSNSSLQAAAYGMTGGISLKVLDKSGNIIPEFNTFTVDKFDVNLTAGTYYVEVSVAPTNPLYGTKYSLSLFNTEIRGGSQSIDGAGRYNDPAAGDKSRKIILSSVPQVINDWVGKKIDDYDDYSFTLNNPTNFLRLALNGMSGSSLIQIIDRNGTTIDTQQTNSGRPFSLERILLAGKYVLRITPAGSSDNDSTSYSLNISSSDVLDQAGRYDDPTGNLSKSLVLSDIPKIVNDRIIKVYESIDDYDDYSFTLKDSTNLFRAFLTGRSGATNMFLLNEKGDSCGDIYSSGFAGDYPPLFLERALGAGKYILRITSDSIATQTSYFNNTEYSLSLSSSVIPDQAGRYDDLAGDRSKVLILTSTPQTINDWVGTSGYSETIINDYDDYSFTITDSTKLFQLALKGLSYNPKITLMTDKGIIIENRLSSFSAAGTVLERSLSAGRYILRIKPDFSTTKYRLTLSAPLLSDKASEYNDLAGSESATAKLITLGASPIRLSDWLGKADPVDFYKFELKETSFFQAALYRLTGNLDFAILDKDGKIIVDANQKQIGYSTGPNQSLESTYLPLFKGTYYLKVYSYTTDQKTFDNSFYDLVIASTPISDLVESNTAILITPIGQFRA